MGIFPDDHDMTRPEAPASARGPGIYPFFVVNNLELAVDRVRELGGQTLDRAVLGPNQVCGCRDDQSTRFGLWLVRA